MDIGPGDWVLCVKNPPCYVGCCTHPCSIGSVYLVSAGGKSNKPWVRLSRIKIHRHNNRLPMHHFRPFYGPELTHLLRKQEQPA